MNTLHPLSVLAIATTCLLAGCAQMRDYHVCDDLPPAHATLAPTALSATGLFTDMHKETLADGVVPYRPRFELWSDGASKRRWISLPKGATIDTSDMDVWQFPDGTKLWKEFTRDGVRVETRMLWKIDGEWVTVAYVPNADGSDAIAAPAGVEAVHGTAHDVPAARNCAGCHGGTRSFVLGFSAIQLAGVRPAGEMSLAGLVRDGRLTKVPHDTALSLPGDATAQSALGYLHANCAHCHNQHRPQTSGPRCFNPVRDFDFSLRVDRLGRVEDTPTYATAIGNVVERGNADESELYRRFLGSSSERMPALGTKSVNPAAAALLHAWIERP